MSVDVTIARSVFAMFAVIRDILASVEIIIVLGAAEFGFEFMVAAG